MNERVLRNQREKGVSTVKRMDGRFLTSKDIILFGYFVTFLILLLDCVDNFPFTSVLRKVKYVYIAILLADFVLNNRKGTYRFRKSSVFILFFFFLHTVLFGLVWTNPDVAEYTATHFREMMIYLGLLSLIVYAVEKYNCRFEFIFLTAVACGIFMLWTGITHFSSFVNPIYFINVFSRNGRYRGGFGTASENCIGLYAFVSLIFYFALWYQYKKRRMLTSVRKACLTLIIFWTLMILFSSASRSSILSFLVFVAFWLYQTFFKKKFGKSRYIFLILGLAIIAIVLWVAGDEIWASANRAANFTVNLPYFNMVGGFWKGMGYIESSSFLGNAYGYETFPVDNYYLYIYLTTGVIGCAILLIPLIYMLVRLLKKKSRFACTIVLPVYISMLFNAFWQVNLFTYRYIFTIFLSILLMITISDREESL